MSFGQKEKLQQRSIDSIISKANRDTNHEVKSDTIDASQASLLKLQVDLRHKLVEVTDVSRLQSLDHKTARNRLTEDAKKILARNNQAVPLSISSRIISAVVDEILGFGPLEPLLRRDDIADIMVNGPYNVMIEVGGKIIKSDVVFQNEQHLLTTCQRIVGQVGRRVDESSPICDARLLDGSRVNVIVPPLAVDGTILTIRKFKKERLMLSDLVTFGSITKQIAELLRIIGRSRCNLLISGGTGSGKTTLLNCITAFIDHDERIITCEDTAELQLQQTHVVRLETRPSNLEGTGEVSMRHLVKNCLRMRPDRIIVGEVRGSEAFDLLQAMNTGHDGSMGTIHANSTKEALNRLETMVVGAGFNMPLSNIREIIAQSLDIVVQTVRLRNGQRVVTQITEIAGIEEGKILTQDLMRYEFDEQRDDGDLGTHRGTGITVPKMAARASYFDELEALTFALKNLNAG